MAELLSVKSVSRRCIDHSVVSRRLPDLLQKTSDQQLEVTGIQLVAKQGHKVPSGLYAGSSVKSVPGPCVEPSALFKETSCKKLIKRRYLERLGSSYSS